MIGSLCGSIGTSLITQFLLPPAFLHYYGVSKYGEWLVLSGAVSYLGSLNIGITTYASNELTMLRKRNEMERYRELQGSTLALLLIMTCIGVAISASVFLIPLAKLLHLSAISAADVLLTAFFLGLQAMTGLIMGYYVSLFMVVEEAHRGLDWSNARRLGPVLITVPLAMFRVQFSVIALGQFVVSFLICLISIYDLKRRMGALPLGLQGANRKTAKATLAPCGMFALISVQQFLIYQAPVIMLQWILGPETVVLFTISRTILSTARQMLAVLTSAISPEITFSFGEGNMKKLLSIFHYSEKIVFGVIPVANLGAFLFSPILLQIWLHKPLYFDPKMYGLMALISGAMSMREHKQYFQFSTNMHKRMAIIVFFGNILMIAISIPFTMKFGLYGFMFVWLVSEVSQMGLIYYENMRLFNNDPSISLVPVLKLGLVMLVSLPICWAMVQYARQRSVLLVGMVAVAGMMMLSVESYFVFGLKEVWSGFRDRAHRRASQA
jgi:O-antigen/teichoic acid export membrane protein